MKLSEEQIIKKAKKVIINENLCNITDLLNHGFTHYQIYKKSKLTEDEYLLGLIELNNKESKELYKKQIEPNRAVYIQKAIDYLDQIKQTKVETETGIETGIHYVNFSTTTNHSLAIALMILPDEWRALELNKNPEIKLRLLRNKDYIYKTACIKLFNNKDTTAALAQIKMYGTDEDRRKLSTSYQDIESDSTVTGQITGIEIIK